MRAGNALLALALALLVAGWALWMGEYLKFLPQVTGEDLRYILTGRE